MFFKLQLQWGGLVGNIDIMVRKLTSDICWLKRERTIGKQQV